MSIQTDKGRDTAAAPDSRDEKGRTHSMLAEVESSRVHPERLMEEISRSTIGKTMLTSTVVHLIIIGLTSVGFIGLCFQYKTMHPRWEIKRIQKEDAEKKAADEQTKAAADAVKRAAERAAAKPETKAAAGMGEPDALAPTGGAAAGTAPPASGAAAPAATPATPGEKAEPKKSKIEQEVEKTSSERPTQPSVSLDGVNDLE